MAAVGEKMEELSPQILIPSSAWRCLRDSIFEGVHPRGRWVCGCKGCRQEFWCRAKNADGTPCEYRAVAPPEPEKAELCIPHWRAETAEQEKAAWELVKELVAKINPSMSKREAKASAMSSVGEVVSKISS